MDMGHGLGDNITDGVYRREIWPFNSELLGQCEIKGRQRYLSKQNRKNERPKLGHLKSCVLFVGAELCLVVGS